jgi:hypothetical protein
MSTNKNKINIIDEDISKKLAFFDDDDEDFYNNKYSD